ncbi:MAG: roadblock/LC7 domain-containing protein [Myxococcales bacterium]|nr:MAG: roadblock/LC7 domain-containing protein [Myxococcales bacterium]
MQTDTAQSLSGILKSVVDRTSGSVSGLLMDFDGLPVEHYVRDNSKVDAETIGAEYSVVLSQIRKAAEMLDAGSAREVAIQAERLTTIIRLLNDDYFVAISLLPGGNIGKARFLLRTVEEQLLAALR